jgi:hypothetical protein
MWNYKTAILSSLVRSTMFFATTASAGLEAATGAMLAEFAFRCVTSGFYGALTQAFRRVQPLALGTFGAVLVLPAAGHLGEFIIHSLRGTPNLTTALATSIAFTGVSTAFNLFAMRRGALIVGVGERSLADDIRAMPKLLFLFVTAISRMGRVRMCRVRM